MSVFYGYIDKINIFLLSISKCSPGAVPFVFISFLDPFGRAFKAPFAIEGKVESKRITEKSE